MVSEECCGCVCQVGICYWWNVTDGKKLPTKSKVLKLNETNFFIGSLASRIRIWNLFYHIFSSFPSNCILNIWNTRTFVKILIWICQNYPPQQNIYYCPFFPQKIRGTSSVCDFVTKVLPKSVTNNCVTCEHGSKMLSYGVLQMGQFVR